MQAFREQSVIVLQLNWNESSLLKRVFREILRNYRTHPSQLDKSANEAWYSTRGCLSAGMSPEQTLEWIDQLHQFRSSHIEPVANALESLEEEHDGDGCAIRLEFEAASQWLNVLNDHRLLVSARMGIGQREMDMDLFEAVRALEPDQQLALCEIELLGQLMELLLHLIPNSGADWRNDLTDDDFLA